VRDPPRWRPRPQTLKALKLDQSTLEISIPASFLLYFVLQPLIVYSLDVFCIVSKFMRGAFGCVQCGRLDARYHAFMPSSMMLHINHTPIERNGAHDDVSASISSEARYTPFFAFFPESRDLIMATERLSGRGTGIMGSLAVPEGIDGVNGEAGRVVGPDFFSAVGGLRGL